MSIPTSFSTRRQLFRIRPSLTPPLNRQGNRPLSTLRLHPLALANFLQRADDALYRARIILLGGAPGIIVHGLDDVGLVICVESAVADHEPPFAVLRILTHAAQRIAVIQEPVREPLALEVGHEAGDDGVDGAEDGDGDVRAVRGAEGGQRGRDDNLSDQAAVDDRCGGVVFHAGLELGVDQPVVEAHVGARTPRLGRKLRYTDQGAVTFKLGVGVAIAIPIPISTGRIILISIIIVVIIIDAVSVRVRRGRTSAGFEIGVPGGAHGIY